MVNGDINCRNVGKRAALRVRLLLLPVFENVCLVPQDEGPQSRIIWRPKARAWVPARCGLKPTAKPSVVVARGHVKKATSRARDSCTHRAD